MGMWDDIIGAGKKAVNTTSGNADAIDKETIKIYETAERVTNGDSGSTNLENWYKQKPYGFRFRDYTFYLPISPSNLNITTHFATNMISTMYGTVEEHSEQRYYDISITGTTGMSPRYYKEVRNQQWDQIGTTAIGRAGYPIKNRVTALGGFFKRTQALVENTLNQVSDLLGDDNGSTGVDLQRTGYAAFHNFYKFLLLHKKVAAGQSSFGDKNKGRGLIFLNYKDNNQYNVVIQNFQLTRDASNPMLYNYNIAMRAYNLKSTNSKDISLDIKSRSAELGLDGLGTSMATKLANKARKAKNAAYSAIAAAKGAGA
jgi:hypothetical protein